MCFAAESLRPSLDEALLRRRGFREVARRTLDRPGPFRIRLDYSIAEASGYFAVAIAGGPDGACDIGVIIEGKGKTLAVPVLLCRLAGANGRNRPGRRPRRTT